MALPSSLSASRPSPAISHHIITLSSWWHAWQACPVAHSWPNSCGSSRHQNCGPLSCLTCASACCFLPGLLCYNYDSLLIRAIRDGVLCVCLRFLASCGTCDRPSFPLPGGRACRSTRDCRFLCRHSRYQSRSAPARHSPRPIWSHYRVSQVLYSIHSASLLVLPPGSCSCACRPVDPVLYAHPCGIV